MGGLWSRVFNTKHEYRILIQGLDASGKTTILYRLKLGEVVTTIPTIGFNVETLTFQNVSITAWDLGGRDKTRPLFRHYYPNTQAIVYVVDSNDRERLEQAKDELHAVLCLDEVRECHVVILANKQDLSQAMTTEEISKMLGMDKVKQNWAIFATVATEGEGLAEAFDWLISQLGHPGVTTGLAKPIEETVTDVKDSFVQSKTKIAEFFHSPYELVKKWFSVV